jgi:hypothetical protein
VIADLRQFWLEALWHLPVDLFARLRRLVENAGRRGGMIGRLGRFTPDRTQSGHGDIALSVAKSGRERLVDSAFSFEYGIAVECRPLTLEEVRVKLM